VKQILIYYFVLFVFAGCNSGEKIPSMDSRTTKALKTIDKTFLDSIKKRSDSSYSKPYKRTDFVSADFYVNKKDSTISQLMKDSAGTIRQVIIAKNKIRTYFAAYYANGQLEADLPLDAFGQYHGQSTYYFENGQTESTGMYDHGLKKGIWKVFDVNGKLLSLYEYDSNGQIIQTGKQP
jgi:antitoxin component YwqK of YwqJK toxin-antitoxin module